jgi:hypothetical protein
LFTLSIEGSVSPEIRAQADTKASFRSSSPSRLVLLADAHCINPKPTKTIIVSDSHRMRQAEENQGASQHRSA